MKTALQAFEQELNAIREAGTWREERIITTPCAAVVSMRLFWGVVMMRSSL